jgi:hypothetical protein
MSIFDRGPRDVSEHIHSGQLNLELSFSSKMPHLVGITIDQFAYAR